MKYSSVITPKVVTGFVSRQTNLGVDSYDLNELYSPDTAVWKSKVLDLGSPKYPPQVATAPQRYWFDRSRYNNHGTITGAIWKQLPSGVWVLSFDGVDDKVTVANSVSIQTLPSFTWMGWFNLANYGTGVTPGFACLFTKGWALRRFRLTGNNGALQISVNTNGTQCLYTSVAGVFVLNVWQLLTTTVSSNLVGKIYINGQEVSYASSLQGSGTPTDDSGVALSIGWDDINTDRYIQGYNGLNRYIRCDLSVTQIANIHNQERHLFGV